jgi:GDP-L-fucose synthase
MHFIFDLARKIVRGSVLGEPVVLWGDGHQKRELIHVDDFIAAMLCLEQKVKNTWINIGSGEEHSIREFAASLCDIVGYPSEQIQYDLSRYVGARSKVLEIQKLKSFLPGFAPRSLKNSLKDVVEWIGSSLSRL